MRPGRSANPWSQNRRMESTMYELSIKTPRTQLRVCWHSSRRKRSEQMLSSLVTFAMLIIQTEPKRDTQQQLVQLCLQQFPDTSIQLHWPKQAPEENDKSKPLPPQ